MLLGSTPTKAPRTFILPRDHAAAAAWISHQDWRTDPTAPPGKRNADVDRARVMVSVFERYEDRWDLLPEPTTNAPVLLPPSYRHLALEPRVGLPPNHPWHENLPIW